jgi:hypothetical protein
VGDEKQRRSLPAAQLEEEIDDLAAGLLVEIAGRFVGKEDAGAARQGPRNGDALLLATRQLAWIMKKPVAEACSGKLVARPRKGVCRYLELQGNCDVIERCHGWDEMKGLEDEADIVAAEDGEFILAHGGEVMTVHANRARSWALKSADHQQQGGLA